jgi:hypothetical protein
VTGCARQQTHEGKYLTSSIRDVHERLEALNKTRSARKRARVGSSGCSSHRHSAQRRHVCVCGDQLAMKGACALHMQGHDGVTSMTQHTRPQQRTLRLCGSVSPLFLKPCATAVASAYEVAQNSG